MSDIVLRIEITPEDRIQLDALAATANQTAERERKARIVADRARTIDQIKRLYAVVVGFALTTSIANSYLCIRALDQFSWEAWSILVAPVISLASLIALFALGAERFLDRKYLQPDSPSPKAMTLFADLFTLASTAGVFVILANVFQAPAAQEKLKLDDLHALQSHFISYLELLYILDIGCLFLNLYRGWATTGLRTAHAIWIAINGISLALLYFVIAEIPDRSVAGLGVSLVALCLAGLHIVRFFTDFLLTFRFYYPDEAL